MPVLMRCGHVAQGHVRAPGKEPRPCCVICYGIHEGADEIADQVPDLRGRIMRCSSCGQERPSTFEAAFFEYGPGERDSYYCGCRGWD